MLTKKEVEKYCADRGVEIFKWVWNPAMSATDIELRFKGKKMHIQFAGNYRIETVTEYCDDLIEHAESHKEGDPVADPYFPGFMFSLR